MDAELVERIHSVAQGAVGLPETAWVHHHTVATHDALDGGASECRVQDIAIMPAVASWRDGEGVVLDVLALGLR